jgi:hypothetical protein
MAVGYVRRAPCIVQMSLARSLIIAWVLAMLQGVQYRTVTECEGYSTVQYWGIYGLRCFGRHIQRHNHRTLTSILKLVRDIRPREHPVKHLQRDESRSEKKKSKATYTFFLTTFSSVSEKTKFVIRT